jgi:hypothetical protein
LTFFDREITCQFLIRQPAGGHDGRGVPDPTERM